MSLVDRQILSKLNLIELTEGVNGNKVKTVDDTSKKNIKISFKILYIFTDYFFCEYSEIIAHLIGQCSFFGRCSVLCLTPSWCVPILSSAVDCRTGTKVAIKKLYRPFQSELFAKRAYRELRLLKHMKHENVRQASRLRTSVVLQCLTGWSPGS